MRGYFTPVTLVVLSLVLATSATTAHSGGPPPGAPPPPPNVDTYPGGGMFPPQPLPNELPPMTAEEAQQLLQGYQEAQENMLREHCCASGQWTHWTACSRDCGTTTGEDGEQEYGHQTRELRCHLGESTITCERQSAMCNVKSCIPEDATPLETWWTSWTDCSAPCGGGERNPTAVNAEHNPHFVLPCNTQDCDIPEVTCSNARVIFVLDSSASVGLLNWYKLLQTTIDVIKGLPPTVQIGVVTYSTTVEKAIPLALHDVNDLEEAIWNLDFMAGTTNTADAIAAMVEMFNRGVSPTDVTPRVGVVITDGFSNISPEQTPLAANLAKQFPNPVTMYALGVSGDVNPEELAAIGSIPTENYVNVAPTYDALSAITNHIAAEICMAIIRGPIIPETGVPLEQAAPEMEVTAERTESEAELARVQAEILSATISAVESVQAAAVAAAVARAREVSEEYMQLATSRREEARAGNDALDELHEALATAERRLENAGDNERKQRRLSALIVELRTTIHMTGLEVVRLESLAQETERISIEASSAAVREATLIETSAAVTQSTEHSIVEQALAEAEYARELAAAARAAANEAAAAVEVAQSQEIPVELGETDIGPHCESCIYDPTRGVKFFADPVNCHQYYVCERIDDGGSPTYRRHHMQCAPSLAYSNDMMTCVVDAQCDEYMEMMEEQGQGNGGHGNQRDCGHLHAVPGQPQMYMQIVHGNPTQMQCPIGLVFSTELCVCNWPQDGTLTSPPRPRDECALGHFPFEYSYDSMGRTTLSGDNYGNIQFQEYGYSDAGVEFDGVNSSLEIPFFNNWFAYNQVEEFTVSMWINPAVGSNAVDLQGVLSNGNCEALSSVKIVIRSGMLYLGLDTDVSVETQGVPVIEGVWQHVTLVYDGSYLTLYLNGVATEQVTAEGPIENRHSALRLGYICDGGVPGHYHGLIDEVRFFKCAKDETEINRLMGLTDMES